MSTKEQRRAWVLSRVDAGEMGVSEAARLLGLIERSVRRLRVRMEVAGPAGLVYGNRGRASPRRLPEATRARILALAETAYADVNDSHLTELLAEREDTYVVNPDTAAGATFPWWTAHIGRLLLTPDDPPSDA